MCPTLPHPRPTLPHFECVTKSVLIYDLNTLPYTCFTIFDWARFVYFRLCKDYTGELHTDFAISIFAYPVRHSTYCPYHNLSTFRVPASCAWQWPCACMALLPSFGSHAFACPGCMYYEIDAHHSHQSSCICMA